MGHHWLMQHWLEQYWLRQHWLEQHWLRHHWLEQYWLWQLHFYIHGNVFFPISFFGFIWIQPIICGRFENYSTFFYVVFTSIIFESTNYMRLLLMHLLFFIWIGSISENAYCLLTITSWYHLLKLVLFWIWYFFKVKVLRV